MNDAWFFIGTAMFIAACALAWMRWWRRLDGIAPANRLVLIATTVGGLLGAIFWWQGAPASFAWALPPLASRMLGAAATAFGLAGLFVLERPSPARARLHAAMTVVYLVPLALAIVALHLDRFDFNAPITWGFFAIVGLLVVASLAGLFTEGGTGQPAPAAGVEAAWLAIAGTVLGIWGLALFAVPAAPYPLVFTWPADPLTSRLIAAMLLTLALVFLLARRDGSLSTQAHLLGAAYGLGVAIAILVNLFRGLPWPPAYLFALGAVGLLSVSFLLARRTGRPA